MDSRSRKLHSRGGLEHLPQCISLVAEAARRAGLSPVRHHALETAVREAYLAIAAVHQQEKHREPVETEVAWDAEWVTVSLVHPGPGLDRLFDRVPADPRVDAMRRSLDEVTYAGSAHDGHRLVMRLRVSEARCRETGKRTARKGVAASR
jgi:hypothetical protein